MGTSQHAELEASVWPCYPLLQGARFFKTRSAFFLSTRSSVDRAPVSILRLYSDCASSENTCKYFTGHEWMV
jgi:hypothetical protein